MCQVWMTHGLAVVSSTTGKVRDGRCCGGARQPCVNVWGHTGRPTMVYHPCFVTLCSLLEFYRSPHTQTHTHTHTHTHTRGPAVVNAPILPLALLLQPPQMWACPQGINKSSHKNIEVICLDSLNWQHCSLTRWCGVWVVSSPALLCLSPVSQK